MDKRTIAFASIAFTCLSGQAIAQILPLRNGFYAEVGVPCDMASNASSLRVDEFGFGFAATITETEVLSRREGSLDLKMSFYHIDDGSLSHQGRWVIVVLSDERVEIHRGSDRLVYRWCTD